MCGITGFISRGFEYKHLESMTRSLQHRGPDAEGFYHDAENGVALGHRRLSILDLSEAANQPFYSKDGRYVMVFNGEIYNYREVAEKYGISAKTTSDSEVLIEAFSIDGVRCLSYLNGMFSLAIWDIGEKKLFLIRDRFGVKPLVYYKKENDFAFASEIKAITKLPIDKEIDMESLRHYLFLEFVPDGMTIFKNVHQLKNGYYLEYYRGEIKIAQWYDFRAKIQSRPLEANSENAIIEKFDEILSSSIEYRQVSDVPVGAFLSGGVDSSLICAKFQEQNTNPINTYTIGFDVAKYDESRFARSVANILKTNHTEARISESSSINVVNQLCKFYDEPFSAPSAIPSLQVCQEAKKNVTVAMSGDGGDELFMGYGHYDLYKKFKKIYQLTPAIGRKALEKSLLLGNAKYQRGSRLFNLPVKNLFVHLWSEQQYMYSEKEISKLLSFEGKDMRIFESWESIDKMNLDIYEKISLFDIEQYLTYNLLYKMDTASMANSLEVRNPYLDYRLMEFSFNLPLHFKKRSGTAKYLMKKLLERYLPKELVHRQKWGFPAPIGNWLTGDLSYLIDQWLSKKRIQQQGIFNEKMIQEYVSAFRKGDRFHDKRIWALVFFQMWYEEYVA